MRLRMTLLSIALLAGCAGQQAATRSPSVNLSGFPLEFRQGYADGCDSAGGVMKRDAKRFEADAQYAQGWRDGTSICRSR